jgi:hypothetical protein
VSVQLDVHPVEPALQVRFEITDEEGASRRREQKMFGFSSFLRFFVSKSMDFYENLKLLPFLESI